jgi:hypothetical protein
VSEVSGKAEGCLESVVDLVNVRINGLNMQSTVEPILEEVFEEEECSQVIKNGAATMRTNVRKLISEKS